MVFNEESAFVEEHFQKIILHLPKKGKLFLAEQSFKKEKMLMSLKWGSLITESNLNVLLTSEVVLIF